MFIILINLSLLLLFLCSLLLLVLLMFGPLPHHLLYSPHSSSLSRVIKQVYTVLHESNTKLIHIPTSYVPPHSTRIRDESLIAQLMQQLPLFVHRALFYTIIRCYHAYKYMRRLYSGRCELERLCLSVSSCYDSLDDIHHLVDSESVSVHVHDPIIIINNMKIVSYLQSSEHLRRVIQLDLEEEEHVRLEQVQAEQQAALDEQDEEEQPCDAHSFVLRRRLSVSRSRVTCSSSSSFPYSASSAHNTSRLTARLVASKSIARTHTSYTSIRPWIQLAVSSIKRLHELQRTVEEYRCTAFDKCNQSHVALLSQCWSAFYPHQTVPPLISSEWEKLGFQGSDPTTDFRSMGLLGLMQLVEFARLEPLSARAIARTAAEKGIKWFSLAITGINITADIVKLLFAQRLNAYVFSHGYDMSSLHRLYSSLLIEFHLAWSQEQPPNVMSFSHIHSQFIKRVEEHASSYPFPPSMLQHSTFEASSLYKEYQSQPEADDEADDNELLKQAVDADEMGDINSLLTDSSLDRSVSSSRLSGDASPLLSSPHSSNCSSRTNSTCNSPHAPLQQQHINYGNILDSSAQVQSL